MIKHLFLLAVGLIGPLSASAQERIQDSGAVWAGSLLFVSGWLDPDLETHSDMKSQTVGVFSSLQELLESQKLTLGDVVMTNRTSPRTPHCRWFCPLLGGAL